MKLLKIMMLVGLPIIFINSCVANKNTEGKPMEKVILDSGIELIIKNKDVLPIEISFQNKKYKIYTDKTGKIIVKEIGLEKNKPPFSNY